MTKFAGKTAICAMVVAVLFFDSRITVGATGMSSVLPAAGLGLELEEGKSVKVVKEDVMNKNIAGSSSITPGKEIVEPIDTKALAEAARLAALREEEEFFTSLVIADVNDYVNVRDIPSETGEIVGKLYDNSVGVSLRKRTDGTRLLPEIVQAM